MGSKRSCCFVLELEWPGGVPEVIVFLGNACLAGTGECAEAPSFFKKDMICCRFPETNYVILAGLLRNLLFPVLSG